MYSDNRGPGQGTDQVAAETNEHLSDVAAIHTASRRGLGRAPEVDLTHELKALDFEFLGGLLPRRQDAVLGGAEALEVCAGCPPFEDAVQERSQGIGLGVQPLGLPEHLPGLVKSGPMHVEVAQPRQRVRCQDASLGFACKPGGLLVAPLRSACVIPFCEPFGMVVHPQGLLGFPLALLRGRLLLARALLQQGLGPQHRGGHRGLGARGGIEGPDHGGGLGDVHGELAVVRSPSEAVRSRFREGCGGRTLGRSAQGGGRRRTRIGACPAGTRLLGRHAVGSVGLRPHLCRHLRDGRRRDGAGRGRARCRRRGCRCHGSGGRRGTAAGGCFAEEAGGGQESTEQAAAAAEAAAGAGGGRGRRLRHVLHRRHDAQAEDEEHGRNVDMKGNKRRTWAG
mmetsp:Transcript_176745/g.561281  ORF Transcript_176745/g.561281 Transcript_176745/m.561281 type:complete len:395 (-) Transcript_176745:121-1305(-)